MLRKVRLEMARGHEFPEGSASHGYELMLPLAADGTLDREHWQKQRKEAVFRRFWAEEETRGRLVHGRRGWALAFDDGSGDAEVILRADAHHFVVGEYVSIKERDEVTRTFRVASIA